MGGKEASTKIADQEIALVEAEFGMGLRRFAGARMAPSSSADASANDGRPIFS